MKNGGMNILQTRSEKVPADMPAVSVPSHNYITSECYSGNFLFPAIGRNKNNNLKSKQMDYERIIRKNKWNII